MILTGTGHPQVRRFVLSMRRPPGISIALALYLPMISLAACQPAAQQQELVGIWIDRDRASYMQFDTDGTWIAGPTFEVLSARQYFGTYRLEGTLLTLETGEKSGRCRGATATYEVELSQLSEQEELTFTLVDDSSCPSREQDLMRSPFERYSP